MDSLESTLNSLMQDPQMMQQLSQLAKTMQLPLPEQPAPAPSSPMEGLDPRMLANLTGLMGQTGIDPNQKSLLSALRPYLNPQRISKLEKAMQAAKMAKLASGILGQTSMTGR